MSWCSGPRGYASIRVVLLGVECVHGGASTVYRAFEGCVCGERMDSVHLFESDFASNNCGRDKNSLDRQAHGLSYKAISDGVDGGNSKWIWVVLQHSARWQRLYDI